MIYSYLSGDFKSAEIQDPYFKGCTNFLQSPDPELYIEYMREPYYKVMVSTTISEAFEQYYQAKLAEAKFQNKSKNTVDEYRGFAERLYDIWSKDKDISTIKKSEILELKEYLMRFPRHFQNNFGKKGISLISVLSGDQGEYEYISASQAKKMWDAYKGFFSWVHENDLIATNPFSEITFKTKRHSQDDRNSFTKEEIICIFSSALYTGRKHKKKMPWVRSDEKNIRYVIKDGYFWIPLLALYSGMRLGEILQLEPKNLKCEDGVYYFDLDNKENLKTSQSKRCIPLHPELIKIGLLKHINLKHINKQKKRKSNSYIFDDIPRCKKKMSNKYSGKFSEYIKRIDVKRKKNSFHSFRHNFEDAMVRAEVSQRSKFAIAGHSGNREWSTNHAYGQNNISQIHKELSKINYDYLDFSNLYE